MLVLTIPIKVGKKLEFIQCRFLWGEDEDKRRYHLIKWEEVKHPVELGRLGLRSLVDLNKARQGQWIWRLWEEDDSLWKKIIKAKWGVWGREATIENRTYGVGF